MVEGIHSDNETQIKKSNIGTVVETPTETAPSDQLRLSKLGEAQRLYEERELQIQVNHELALKLFQGEEAGVIQEKE